MTPKFFKLKKYIDKKTAISLFLILFIPMLASIILGFEMKSDQIKNIPTVIVDHDHSEFSRMLMDEITTNEVFEIKDIIQTDSELKMLIEQNQAMVGVIIPDDFYSDLQKGIAPKILIFYDDSQMSVASAAKSRMAEILLTLKAGYMKKVYEGKLNIVPEISMKHIQPITATYRQLYNPAKSYRNFLLPGMLIAILQVGLVIIGVERAKDGCKKYIDLLKKNMIWAIIGFFSIMVTLGIQCIFFHLPFKGSIVAGLVLSFAYAAGMIAFGIIVGLLIPDRVFATQLACILVLPSSILGGYTFPLFAMPEFFNRLGWFLPYTHFAEGIRDLCLKDLSFSYLLKDIGWIVSFLCIELVMVYLIFFIKEKSVKKAERTEAII